MTSRLASLLPRCAGLLLLCVGLAAHAQNDPPGRVARLNFHQGTVSFAPAGDDQWYDGAPNRPLTTGDRLWTDRNARAELNLGPASLRLDEQTALDISELGDDTVRVTTQQGRLQLRVRPEAAGTRFEVQTDNLALVIDQPGDYRIDSDPAAGTTWVGVNEGNATLYGANGQSQPLGAQQQIMVSGRDLDAVRDAPLPAPGRFDQWVAERDRLEDQSVSARYVSRDMVGYQQLDNYGDWQNDGTYGSVWYPRGVAGDWAPYQDGQWVDVAPWGPTWVDAAPWGFAPFHYGRWARIGPRWGWVPGQRNLRPAYSPALVGFVGGHGGAIPIGGGRNGVGWFPLAPGEAWRPGFRASQRYVDQVNRGAHFGGRPPGMRDNGYLNQGLPGAVTVVPSDRFGRGGRIGRNDLVQLPQDRFARLPVLPNPGLSAGRNPFGAVGRPGGLPPGMTAQPRPVDPGQAAARQIFESSQRIRQQQQPQAPFQPPMAPPPRMQPPPSAPDAGQSAMRQQMELQRRLAAQQQMQQQMQQQTPQRQPAFDAMRQQQEMQQRAAQAQQQQQVQQQQNMLRLQQMQQQALQQQQQQQQRGAQMQQQQMQQQQQLQRQRPPAMQAPTPAQGMPQQPQRASPQDMLRRMQEEQRRAQGG